MQEVMDLIQLVIAGASIAILGCGFVMGFMMVYDKAIMGAIRIALPFTRKWEPMTLMYGSLILIIVATAWAGNALGWWVL